MKGETNVENVNINIDLDENIIDFCREKISKEIDMNRYINNIVKAVCKVENIFIDEINVSITSASKDEIKEYNNKYRGIDRVTDVLSFPIFTKEELDDIKNEPQYEKKIKSIELGDIIVCLDVVMVQAVEYGTGILRELLYMITHAMCHLVGYDHIKEEEKIKMRELEERVLNMLGVEKNV